jgi:GntR family transcriptional regulator
MTVDYLSPEPLYLQLARILRERIQQGDFAHGPLPSNRSLREQYDVGEFVVTHAIQVLVEEGLVISIPRRGVYVAPTSTS